MKPTRASRTLASTFDPAANSLNAARLLFAGLVLVSHAVGMAGVSAEPELGGMTVGRWGVMGFFTVSGYLICRSRDNTRSMLDFAEARAARILPGLFATLLVTAFVFAPISVGYEPDARWDPSSAVRYVLHNAPLYPPRFLQEGIDDTLVGVPYEGIWNGSLWTLFWEAACYVAVAVAFSLVPVRVRRVTSVVALAVAMIAALPNTLGIIEYPGLGSAIDVCVAFAAGAVAYFWAGAIRVSAVTVVALLTVIAASIVTGTSADIAPLPFIILLLPLSTAVPLHRVGSRFDASYGFYVYAWPVQQLTCLALGPVLPFPLLLILQILSTLGLGYLSSLLVERPAQRRARARRLRRAVQHEQLRSRPDTRTGDDRSALSEMSAPDAAHPGRTC
ncbi:MULTISPECIES: acyltransferase [unclassified Curtobacterium]|uniref:acyltransferase family protein n=1 Tax=unclassified Curtobacterium TaxID=257496 RepID=UPI000DA99095|nr:MULTISPECIES: acyltransferase family protein [unclassified Curtobacterium]PZE39335.1 hypothetical protein DEJ31_00315 [Curtobacterium sp. MCPF17_031]PZF13517.1 hypothetical protein DEJ25_07105 [Curtobacterium sp. MCPF17_011]